MFGWCELSWVHRRYSSGTALPYAFVGPLCRRGDTECCYLNYEKSPSGVLKNLSYVSSMYLKPPLTKQWMVWSCKLLEGEAEESFVTAKSQKCLKWQKLWISGIDWSFSFSLIEDITKAFGCLCRRSKQIIPYYSQFALHLGFKHFALACWWCCYILLFPHLILLCIGCELYLDVLWNLTSVEFTCMS